MLLSSINLQLQKDFAGDKFPEHKAKIEGVRDEDELTNLLESIGDQEPPTRKPSGRATLPPATEHSSLDAAPDHQSMINRLYEATKSRGRSEGDISSKKEATEKINRLWDSMKEGGYLQSEKMARTMATGETFSICPKCGAVTEYLGHRNAGCRQCDYVVGQGDKIRK